MKKLLLAITATLALSAPMVANADITWQQTHKSEAQVSSINHNNATAFVCILKDHTVEVGMVIELKPNESFHCENNTLVEAPVNGRYVNFIRVNQGTNSEGNNVCIYFPYTKAGMSYVVNEFKNKNTVTLNSSKFTAKGYNKIVKQILKTTKQEAL